MIPTLAYCVSLMKKHFMCGTVNRNKCRVRGSDNSHDVAEHKRDSLKVSAWCASIKDVISPLFLRTLR